MTAFLRRVWWNMTAAALLILLMISVFSCSGHDDDVINLKLSLVLGSNSDWYRGAQKFKELVEARTDGRYRIRLFPHVQLAGNQRTELEMLETGVIDLSLESSILLSLIEPEMSVLSLPWLFDSYDEANAVCDGPLGRDLLGLLPEKNIVGLAFGANGFRQLSNSKRPVRSPEDIADMKVRVPGIRMYVDLFKYLGADPSSMNFAEVFTALAQGTMDGQENPLSVIYYARLYEVQQYLTLWNYSYDPIILCMNKQRWESLSENDRTVFSRCAIEAMRYERDLVANGEAALIDSLTAKGMDITSLSLDETGAFRLLAEPAYKKLADEVGWELINKFREAAEN